MPVSHLGLTVSHIPSAASFYLSALQPLGYRFIGHQGDSIGLGIKDADFFITQGPRGATIAPTHIAFAADDRTQVRECYTSALKGGGRPNGPPGYRHNDCGCFNSAVEDLDGNTIEFIFRENGPCAAEEPAAAPSEHSRVLNWQEGVSREAQDGVAPQEDAASVMSKAKTAVDAASSASKSADKPAEEAPEAPASEKGVMAALAEGITPKAILGGAIGAVAAAGIAYAFYQSEQESAREEAAHKSSIAASSERGRRYSTQAPTQYAPMKRSISAAPPRSSRFHRNYSTTESVAPPPKTHRNFSVTESRVGPRPEPTQVPTQAPTAMKAIEARAFDNDSEIQAALSRHTSRRPTMARSQTFEPSVYTAPMSTATRSRAPPQRSATLADEPSVRSHLLLEGPKDLIPSSNSLRSNRDDDADLQRHDSAASAFSHRSSKHSRRDDGERRSSASQAPTVKSSSKRDDGERSQAGSIKSSSTLKRAASRYEESRSQRDPETLSDASTIKASRRDSAAHIPLPPSKASSKVSARTAAEYRLPDSAATSRAPTQVSAMPASRAQSHASAAQPSPAPMDSPVPSYYAPPPQDKPKSGSTASSQQTALRVPLPASRAPSQATAAPAPSQASRRGSQVSSRHPPAAMSRRLSHSSGSTVRYPAAIPLPASVAGQNYDDVEDSDGMGDIKTVVPDDSISCIDISQPKAPRSDYSRHSERSHRSHRTHHTSSRSKHPHRSSEDKSREPGDAQTIVPDDSISSVGSKHSHRSHREREHKSHHGGSSRSSRHHKSHSHEKKESSSDKDDDDEGKDADPTPLDARTVLPEESISSVGAPAPRSHYSDAKSHHSSSRSKHGSSRREDDGKSHHSSSGRSKHRSHKDEDGKERRRKEGGSEAGKSDATVKPAKSKVAGMSLPSILRGGREKERERERDERRSEKRSVVSYA